MGLIWVSHGIHFDYKWDKPVSSGNVLGFKWDVSGFQVEFIWFKHLGYMWDVCGIDLGLRWDPYIYGLHTGFHMGLIRVP